jgi:homocysteine S-methyltransferase
MPTNPLDIFLATKRFVLLDGALATELERYGADLRDSLWSARLLVENPDLIRRVHLDYLDAGADVITTASYQATLPGFARHGLSAEQAADLLRLSVELARQARAGFLAAHPGRPLQPLVAASVGPYGAYLSDGSEYRGDYGLSVTELMDFHRPRLAVLAAAEPDLFAFETIPNLAEAQALVQLLAELPETAAWLSFSCRDDTHVSSGEAFADGVAIAAASPQVVAVGVNCTAPRFVEELLHCARRVTARPLVCYPNSGERWDAQAKCWVPGTGAAEFGAAARRWYDAGARLLGGCCRTTPDDIRAIASALLT